MTSAAWLASACSRCRSFCSKRCRARESGTAHAETFSKSLAVIGTKITSAPDRVGWSAAPNGGSNGMASVSTSRRHFAGQSNQSAVLRGCNCFTAGTCLVQVGLTPAKHHDTAPLGVEHAGRALLRIVPRNPGKLPRLSRVNSQFHQFVGCCIEDGATGPLFRGCDADGSKVLGVALGMFD